MRCGGSLCNAAALLDGQVAILQHWKLAEPAGLLLEVRWRYTVLAVGKFDIVIEAEFFEEPVRRSATCLSGSHWSMFDASD